MVVPVAGQPPKMFNPEKPEGAGIGFENGDEVVAAEIWRKRHLRRVSGKRGKLEGNCKRKFTGLSDLQRVE